MIHKINRTYLFTHFCFSFTMTPYTATASARLARLDALCKLRAASLKAIALRPSLLLRGFHIATGEQYGVETSLSTFLIACNASYQKCAQWGFYDLWFVCCHGRIPMWQRWSQSDRFCGTRPWTPTANQTPSLLLCYTPREDKRLPIHMQIQKHTLSSKKDAKII